MCHQWRSSMNGYYGLDMSVLPLYFRHMKVPRDQRDEVFEALHVMERAALTFLQSKRPRT